MRSLSLLALLLCVACSRTYVVPDQAVAMAAIGGETSSVLESVPKFPARLAVVRVQGAAALSHAGPDRDAGDLIVMASPPSPASAQIQQIGQWPEVLDAAAFDPDDRSGPAYSMDALRLSAAKQLVDILLVCTVGTALQADGRTYDAGASVPLQPAPKKATFSSHASASFVDVRTGFVYGSVQADASAAVAEDWQAPAGIDRRRLESEQRAMAAALQSARKTWTGIVAHYQ